jgi:hypothetical protein
VRLLTYWGLHGLRKLILPTKLFVALMGATILSTVCTNDLPRGLIASAVAGESKSMQMHVDVYLDMLSGMPNPKWVLTEVEENDFVARLATATATSSGTLPDGFGYNGFVVVVKSGGRSQDFRIHNGIIYLLDGINPTRLQDKNRELERWLFKTGKPHLKKEQIQMIESAL